MTDPAHFPPEITTHIFDCATNDNRDAKSLARFCRVNRQWNALARPRLYMRWTYHGEKHSIGSLWKFLCSVIRNHQIASLVQSVKSLEHLDIYRDCTGTSPHVHHKNISHFGSLREFEHLKKICIQPEALLGGCFGEPKAPFRLKDTLPASLESLTFYGSNGLILDLGLAEQFREILLSGDFTHLKSIVFEDVSEFVSCFIPSYVSRPNQVVKEICKEARVTFRERKGHHFLKGGKRLPWFMQACRMRTLREHKREILTDDEDLSEEIPSDSEYDVPRPNSGDLNVETKSLDSDEEVDWEDESSDLGSEELDSGDSLSDDWNEEVVDEDA
jgi:hypothetical protein